MAMPQDHWHRTPGLLAPVVVGFLAGAETRPQVGPFLTREATQGPRVPLPAAGFFVAP